MHTEPNESLVQELRKMFLDGATPSRLLQRLLDEPASEETLGPGVVDRYFSAAFGSKVYPLTAATQGEVFSTLHYAYLNGDTLYQMLENLSEWRRGVEGDFWCDDVEAIDARVKLREFSPQADPELARFWDGLDPKAQAYIRACVVSLQVAQEKIHALRLLAERLQQKLVQAEER